MFHLSFPHKKNSLHHNQSSIVFRWKLFIVSMCIACIVLIGISYNIFSKTDKDPFVADTANTIGGVKQYNSNKVQNIKYYFDQKEVIYNTTVTTKLLIGDPSI